MDFVEQEDLEILQRLAAECDTVFVSGSRVEGLGNRHSDVDFFLVRSDEHSVLQQPAIRQQRYVDCEYHTFHQLMQLAEHVNGESDALYRTPTDRQLDLYYRTAIGIPIINAERFKSLQARFSTEVAAQAYATVAEGRGRRYLSEAKASLACDDRLRSVFAARSAAEWATNSLLARAGEAYPSTKWRFEKAVRRFGRRSSVYEQIWSVHNIGNRTAEEYVRLVEQAFARWSIGKETQAPERSRVVCRGLKVSAVDLRDGWSLLTDSASVHRVTSSGRAIWDEMEEPTTQHNLAARVAGRLSLGLQEAEVLTASFIDSLERRGLVVIQEAD